MLYFIYIATKLVDSIYTRLFQKHVHKNKLLIPLIFYLLV